MNENPFYHSRDLDRVEWFYNRRSEMREALDLLHAYETVKAKGTIEVTGPRRIGKTWFLHYISHPSVLQERGIDPQRIICVYIDCQRLLIHQEKVQIYQRILGRIVDAARRVGCDPAPEPGSGYEAGAAFEQALKEMHRQGLRTILLLDEFEAMAHNTNLDGGFFNHLRALAGADDINVTYVTASSTSLIDLALERESLIGSPFFNIFQPIPLGLFSEQDSRHLVEETLRSAGTSFPRALLELVLEVGGRYPFFLQMAGHHAFNLAVAGEELTEDQRKAFLENVGREATRHFKYYWRHLTPQERYVLAALPLVQSEETYQEQLEALTDFCLIIEENSQWQYFSPLFRDFVRRQEVPEIKLVRNVREPPTRVKAQPEETYIDFDLHVAPNGYVVANSIEGKASAKISIKVPSNIPLSLKLIEKRAADAELLKEVGQSLYDWLFPEPIRTHFQQTEAVARRNNIKMRLRLRIEAEEIASLPLEFLYRRIGEYYIAVNPGTVLSRYLNLPMPPGYVRRREGPLHMLAIIADPADQTRLPPNEWEAIIQEALSGPLDSGQMTLQTVKRATRKEIRHALLRQKPDIIQFVGHGIYENSTGYLALVDESTGKTWQVNDEQFADLLVGYDDHLGLISLATCESAKSDNPQGFLGIAPKLVQRGVPAVLSMQYKVYIKTAKVFLEEFYAAVAARKPIDWATQSARNAISLEYGLDNREFATPVLYMRADEQRSSPTGQSQVKGQETMISSRLRSNMVDALYRVPLTTTIEGRTMLLNGIPRIQDMARSMNSHVDLTQIIKQLDTLGRLDSGDWPVMMLIDNALAYVEGTDLAKELQAIQRRLEGTIQQTQEISDFFEKSGFTVQVLSGTSLSVRCFEKAGWRRYGEIYVKCIEDDVNGADVRAVAARAEEERTLDEGLAFLVHSGRLVKGATQEFWTSKQKGLVIVPLHTAMLSESLTESPQVCYARLRSLRDGWCTLSDPYENIISKDPQWFVGRQQRIREAMDSIEQSKAVGIFGGRRYGKTVFLNQLDSACLQKGYPVTYLLCTPESSLSDLLEGIIEDLVHCVRKLYPQIDLLELSFGNDRDITAAKFQTHMTKLGDALSQVEAERPKCVLLLDEVDNIVPEEESPEQIYRRYVEFFQAIKGVTERVGFLSLAVAGYSPAILNRKDRLQGQPHFEHSHYENPMYDRFNEIRLPLMNKEETDELVQNLGDLIGLEYPEPSLQEIRQETQGHPEITRKLCSSILEEQMEQGRQPGIVTPEIVDMAVRRFLSDTRQTFYFEETYWNLALGQHPDLVKLILYLLAKVKAHRSKTQIVAQATDRSLVSLNPQEAMKEIENALTSLEDLGLISCWNDECRIVIPLVWRWIRKEKLREDPFDTARRQSDV